MSAPAGRPAHGLVLGKFYPPHAGHLHLIGTAARECERVSVLLLAASWEAIPLADRAAWLRELTAAWPNVTVSAGMDDTPVDYDDPAIWQRHMAVFVSAIAAHVAALGLPPEAARVDAVFSSEAYGPELARRFGAAHRLVDQPRAAFPVSGTACRERPETVWEWIPAPVRPALVRRVVIIGSESTGSTTLARALTAHYQARGGAWAATRWVPEYGRDYTHLKLDEARAIDPAARMDDLAWTTEDFVRIAARQCAMEDEAAREGSPVLFCDTDALATGIWHERYLGTRAPAVEAIARAACHDLYLLTDHEGVPFEPDGIRDGEHLRAWMTGRFREELAAQGHPVVELRGPHPARLARAIAAVDALLAAPPRLGRPTLIAR